MAVPDRGKLATSLPFSAAIASTLPKTRIVAQWDDQKLRRAIRLVAA
jgi:hypothetical protein